MDESEYEKKKIDEDLAKGIDVKKQKTDSKAEIEPDGGSSLFAKIKKLPWKGFFIGAMIGVFTGNPFLIIALAMLGGGTSAVASEIFSSKFVTEVKEFVVTNSKKLAKVIAEFAKDPMQTLKDLVLGEDEGKNGKIWKDTGKRLLDRVKTVGKVALTVSVPALIVALPVGLFCIAAFGASALTALAPLVACAVAPTVLAGCWQLFASCFTELLAPAIKTAVNLAISNGKEQQSQGKLTTVNCKSTSTEEVKSNSQGADIIADKGTRKEKEEAAHKGVSTQEPENKAQKMDSGVEVKGGSECKKDDQSNARSTTAANLQKTDSGVEVKGGSECKKDDQSNARSTTAANLMDAVAGLRSSTTEGSKEGQIQPPANTPGNDRQSQVHACTQR